MIQNFLFRIFDLMCELMSCGLKRFSVIQKPRKGMRYRYGRRLEAEIVDPPRK